MMTIAFLSLYSLIYNGSDETSDQARLRFLSMQYTQIDSKFSFCNLVSTMIDAVPTRSGKMALCPIHLSVIYYFSMFAHIVWASTIFTIACMYSFVVIQPIQCSQMLMHIRQQLPFAYLKVNVISQRIIT